MKKMNFKMLFILILFSCNNVFAQKELVDLLMTGTVKIKYSNGGSASGIIIGDSNYLYLVTAKHCLVNDKNLLLDTLLSIIYYNGDAFETKADTISLNLNNAIKTGDILCDNFQDIGILSFAKVQSYSLTNNIILYQNHSKMLTRFSPKGISLEVILNFNKVDVGNDCYIFGFPSSLQTNSKSDYDFDRPLLRKGVMAGKNKILGTIIVDCPVYQGNSGGPVFAISNNYLKNKNTGLIGIVSRSVLHSETLENTYYKSIQSVN